MITKVKESPQVKRARRKIEERLLDEQNRMTPEAIHEAITNIHYWLARHSTERLDLKDRTIYRDAESTKSKFIIRMMQQLQKDTPFKKQKHLKGRIIKE